MSVLLPAALTHRQPRRPSGKSSCESRSRRSPVMKPCVAFAKLIVASTSHFNRTIMPWCKAIMGKRFTTLAGASRFSPSSFKRKTSSAWQSQIMSGVRASTMYCERLLSEAAIHAVSCSNKRRESRQNSKGTNLALLQEPFTSSISPFSVACCKSLGSNPFEQTCPGNAGHAAHVELGVS